MRFQKNKEEQNLIVYLSLGGELVFVSKDLCVCVCVCVQGEYIITPKEVRVKNPLITGSLVK